MACVKKAEKPQCVLWTEGDHGFTAFQRKFWIKYLNLVPGGSLTRRWYVDLKCKDGHTYMGGNGSPQISNENNEMTWIILNESPWMSVKIAATQAGLQHTTIWNSLKQELSFTHTSYEWIRKSMIWQSRIGLDSAKSCRSGLRICPELFIWVVSSDECKCFALWIC